LCEIKRTIQFPELFKIFVLCIFIEKYKSIKVNNKFLRFFFFLIYLMNDSKYHNIIINVFKPIFIIYFIYLFYSNIDVKSNNLHIIYYNVYNNIWSIQLR
jgi:hypothetical protein